MSQPIPSESSIPERRQFALKRAFDIVVSIALAPIALVLSALFYCLFFVLTRENPLFAQERIGAGQKPFTLYKLRTMETSTKNLPTHEVSSAGIPRIGRLMRAIKVDELPQLYNVLRGEMSLVGPRPCLPTQSDLINERENRNVYSLLPGITGYAQVAGIDMSNPKTLAEADQHYLNNQSMLLDLRLLVQTALGFGSGDRTS